MTNLPETQYAVQLVGADELFLNRAKKVIAPRHYQILCRVEAVGLCFSDLKLLKQFSGHPRKGGIVSGIDSEILKEISSYVPGESPTVPGHETVVRIEAAGGGVEKFKRGERYLVQTDYRWLQTEGSNASFGYNFEGALQEYVLMDERVITSPEGDLMLIPVSEELSSSAVALVEPWACVENSYASKERRSLKRDGQMLVVADIKVGRDVFVNLFERYGRVGQITWVSKFPAPAGLDATIREAANISEVKDDSYDDVIYFGSSADAVESLYSKVGAGGLLNIVLCEGKLGRDVRAMVGQVHYGGIRIVGTMGAEPAESMEAIPESGAIRCGETINIIGAGGPMGMMHVIRNICQGVEGVSIFAGDVDERRLASLSKIAATLAKKNVVEYKPYNPTKEKINETFDYTVLMVPEADLVGASVRNSAKGGIINIFAGIAASVSGEIDLDTYIEKQLYFVGTSGSELEDMRRVLSKVESGSLDTNVSVAAVGGLAGAIDGIIAIENRQIAGKIIIYPSCKELGLVSLGELSKKLPEVAKCLNNGLWSKKAEERLLKMHENP